MYGIGQAIEGVNRGVEQHRQIKRQESQDDQQRKLQEAQLENYGLRMDSTRQQMDQRQTEFGWKADDREQLEVTREEQDMLDRGRRLAAMASSTGDYTVMTPVVGEMFERVYNVRPDAVVPTEDAYLVTINGQTQSLPFSEALDQAIYTPKDFIETKREAEKLRKQAEAEQEQARLESEREHEKWLREQAVDTGAARIVQGEDGGFGLQHVPVDQRAPDVDPSSRHADVLAYAASKGIEEGLAWDIILNREENPDRHIIAIEESLREQYQWQHAPTDDRFKEARRIYEDLVRTPRQDQYGIGGQTGGGDRSAGPASSSSRQATTQQGDGSSAQSPLDAASLTSAPPAGTFIQVSGRPGMRDGVYRVESNGDIRRVGE